MKKTKLFSKLTLDLEKEIKKNSHTKNLGVRIECTNGVLKVSGIVKSYFQKQLVLNIAIKSRGNSQIEIQDGVTVKQAR